ncbi:aquaporin-4 [Astyanax mexicanus]|uniref:Aquaporin 14 n=2 Tax=Astyanax mexicanus TaxID=7994 RepID=A0A3B1KI57_ASTMX|nr:aquaporin-4 [Astyanax mexicanus]KAG9269283.1 aquaporin-4-like [Astyanax mexicanus]QKE23180.1 aquaporin 14 [Astyanax mexicanus]
MTLREEVRSRQFWRSMLAEILASLVFVSAVLGSSLPGSEGPSLGPIYPALAAGMATVGLGHCFGEISGAQVNPAVTLALLATRRLDVLRAVVYVVAQCLGAILGAGIFYLVLPLKFTAEIYVNKVPMEVNAGQALGAEMLATFQLAFTVFSVEDQRRREGSEPGNIAIGFSVSAGIFIAGKISGGCLNPARSLGPAIIAGYWEHHWVFWIGPVLGAVLAGVSHEFFFAPSASRQKLVACLTCKDIEIVETASVSRSSLSTVTQTAMRAKQTNKLEHN